MCYKRGFSLVEVVVAVGIFALAIVGVIGLLSPTNKAVADVADTDSASRAISAIQAGLQEAGFSFVVDNLSTSATNPEYKFAASKTGDKIGLKTNNTLFRNDNTEKFFEFALLRNETLSPPGPINDNAAGFIAFTIRIRWPAYLPNGQEFTANDQKGVLIVPAAVTR